MKKSLSAIFIALILVSYLLFTGCNTGDRGPSTNGNNQLNGNIQNPPHNGEEDQTNEDLGQSCTSHSYADNVCSVCGCSRWNGNVDTDWYSAAKSEIEITKAEELAGIAQLVSEGTDFTGVTVILGADIDLNGKEWTPIGNKTKPFKGTFNANEHSIFNLKITGADALHTGFFGYLEGNVKNLDLKNVSFDIPDFEGSAIGGLAGYCCGIVENCSISGKISVKSYGIYLAGLVGYLYGGSVDSSYSDVEVITEVVSSGDGSFKEYPRVGGLIGSLHGSKVTKCFSDGDITVVANGVTATYIVGGLVGYCRGAGSALQGVNVAKINNCYATGNISFSATGTNTAEKDCEGNIGGLIGQIGAVNVSNCYASGNIEASIKNYKSTDAFSDTLKDIGTCYAGGLIANCENEKYSSVSNCFAVGNIEISAVTECAYRLCPKTYHNINTVNCFYYKGQTISAKNTNDTEGSAVVKLADFYGNQFYDNRLEWSQSVWNYRSDGLPTQSK